MTKNFMNTKPIQDKRENKVKKLVGEILETTLFNEQLTEKYNSPIYSQQIHNQIREQFYYMDSPETWEELEEFIYTISSMIDNLDLFETLLKHYASQFNIIMDGNSDANKQQLTAEWVENIIIG